MVGKQKLIKRKINAELKGIRINHIRFCMGHQNMRVIVDRARFSYISKNSNLYIRI